MLIDQHKKGPDGPDHLRETMDRIARERGAAAQRMAEEFAGLHMPEDIRSRARTWGMEAWATVLWSNAFQAGYRAGLRSHGTIETEGQADG